MKTHLQKIALCCALLCLAWGGRAQSLPPYDGNGLLEILDMDISDPRMQLLRTFLAEDPNADLSESLWFSRQKGLELGIEGGKIVRLFVHGRSPYNYGTMPFVGHQLLGYSHSDTESAIVQKLGAPFKRESWGALIYYVEHKGFVYHVSIEMNSDGNSVKHTYVKRDEDEHRAMFKALDYGGLGRTPSSKGEQAAVSNMGGAGVNMMLSAGSTGCVQGNCYNGVGTFLWDSGSKYIGDFKDGKRTGFGTYYFPNGDVYVGEWADNFRHGTGMYEYAQKGSFKKYVGEWRAGKRSGMGMLFMQNGSSKLGEWNEDVLRTEVSSLGKGCISGDCQGSESKYVWEDDGALYVGQYSDGMKNGSGTYYYPKGGKYVGQFKNGLRHGKGTYYYPNGSRYEGYWEEDKRQGQGTLYRKGGQTLSGSWFNDQLKM